MKEQLRCRRCRDVIGVYEPMVVLAEGEARETSVLDEELQGPLGDCYHRSASMRRPDRGGSIGRQTEA